MKIVRIILIILLGLATALIVYPFLHETGHTLMTIFCGGKVCEFSLLPQPYVLCDMKEVNEMDMILIGISGMIFPLLFTWIIHLKNIWFWFFGLFLNYICFLSFSLSIFMCIMFQINQSISNEDMIKVLEMYPEGVGWWILLFVILMIVILVQVIRTHPAKKLTMIASNQ